MRGQNKYKCIPEGSRHRPSLRRVPPTMSRAPQKHGWRQSGRRDNEIETSHKLRPCRPEVPAMRAKDHSAALFHIFAIICPGASNHVWGNSFKKRRLIEMTQVNKLWGEMYPRMKMRSHRRDYSK